MGTDIPEEKRDTDFWKSLSLQIKQLQKEGSFDRRISVVVRQLNRLVLQVSKQKNDLRLQAVVKDLEFEEDSPAERLRRLLEERRKELMQEREGNKKHEEEFPIKGERREVNEKVSTLDEIVLNLKELLEEIELKEPET